MMMIRSALRLSLLLPVAALAIEAAAQPASTTIQETKTPMSATKEIAVLETSMGTFEIELYRSDAPKTVENFTKLAGQKYFDGMRFHRVSRGFVIQAGDEKSKDTAKSAEWGTGGRSIYGKEFEDELNPATASYREGYRKGVVAMANRGRNTNTSQFFVMLNDAPNMPKNYTIFGRVVKGLEVVEKIGRVDVIPNMGPTDGRPRTDVMLKKVTIRPDGK